MTTKISEKYFFENLSPSIVDPLAGAKIPERVNTVYELPSGAFRFGLESSRFFTGYPNGLDVKGMYEQDGRVHLTGDGPLAGSQQAPTFYLNYHQMTYTRKTLNGGTVLLPHFGISVGLEWSPKFVLEKLNFDMSFDREAFLASAHTVIANSQTEAVDEIDTPDNSGSPDSLDEIDRASEAALDEMAGSNLGQALMIFGASLMSGFGDIEIGDYYAQYRTSEFTTLNLLRLPLTLHLTKWGRDDAGWGDKARFAMLEQINLDLSVIGSLATGPAMDKPTLFVGGGATFDLSLMTFYFSEDKYPAYIDFSCKAGMDYNTNFSLKQFSVPTAGCYVRFVPLAHVSKRQVF